MDLLLTKIKLLVAFLFLTSCAALSNDSSTDTLYSYQLQNPSGQPISIEELVTQMAKKEVILIGEWHTHPAIHLFQAQFFARLIKQKSAASLALSLEQFARSEQIIVDHYLEGKIGEHTLIKKGKAWPNYQSDYRPLIELAKESNIDVIAANTPIKITRGLAKEGITFLEKLSAKERLWVAQKLTTEPSAYQEKFFNSMHHTSKMRKQKSKENQYLAQTAWDDTMAESIVNYLATNTTAQVVHIAGAFHVEDSLGIASRIKALNPKLDIGIITPKSVDNAYQQDNQEYRIMVKALPKKWLNYDEMKDDMKKHFSH